MITIPTKELRKFMSLAQHIKDTRILPIYGYVKIVSKDAVCTFYKSNGHSFIISPMKDTVCGEDEVILIEEKILFGFITYCSGTMVTISCDGLKGLLDDKKRPTKFIGEKDNYPSIQAKEDSETWELDSDVLAALSLSKAHTFPPSDKTIREWNTFVHLANVGKKFGVAGFNGFTFYFQTFKQKLPLMVFDTDTIGIISKFDSVTYGVSGNYQLFDCDGVVYGFIMPEIKPRDLTTLFENLNKGEYAFTVNRKSILQFCESVLSMNNTNVPPTITISGDSKESNIVLKHVGLAGLSPEEPIWVEDKKVKFEDHIFDPKHLIMALKELSFDDIKVSIIDIGFVFSSDEEPNYIGGAMKMSKL